MTTDVLYLRDLISVDADFKPSVQLPFDFFQEAINERLIRSFIPTSQSIAIFTEIAHSLDLNGSERARSMVGTFGTGKSDLLLMICNYLGRSVEDPLMQPFYERLKGVDATQAAIIRRRREGQPPFLVVLLQADIVSSFPGFVLHGLQEALEQQNLGHLIQKTRYAAACEQIESWQRTQHPRYSDFCKTIEEHEKIDITGLLAALRGPQSDDALRRFMRTYKTVIGADFPIYGYSQPHEAYAEVAQALVEAGTFSGILLVCDEFTAFFERFQSAIDQQLREVDAETKAVENLAERCASSGRAQIHFIVASLEPFASAAGRIGSGSVAQATERTGGRFKQHSLEVQGSEELIRGTIKRLPAAERVELLSNVQRDELMQIAGEIGKLQLQAQWRNREWVRDKIVEGSFPLHPFSTYALPLVNQRVAQSQRTMFLFLKDDKGLRGFIEREPLDDTYPGWRRLLTLDRLFDYFHESIFSKRSDILDAFESAEQKVRSAETGRELADRILKIVALCEVIGNDQVLRPTRLFLRRALNLPSADETDFQVALNLLEQEDALVAPGEADSTTGIYSLPTRGWVSTSSLRQRIIEQARKFSATDASKLQATYPPEPIDALDYNSKRGSHRELSAYYINLLTLRSRERLKSDLEDSRNQDGLLWYVITSTDEERAEAQSLARELTRLHNRLVVAVPVAPSQVLRALRDYQALDAVRRDPNLEPGSKAYLEDKGKLGKAYKDQLDRELSNLIDRRQWEWFANGRGDSGLSNQAVTTLASQVMEMVFPRTPNTSFRQHFKDTGFSSPILKAVEQILKGNIQIAKNTKNPSDKILQIGGVALGLLQQEKTQGAFEVFVLADPTSSANSASSTIWQRMSDHLAAGKPWNSLVRELRQPPFGLYDSILIFFLAVFIARNADSVSILRSGLVNRPLAVDQNVLKALLEKPQDYTLRYYKLTEPEKRWLRGMVERGLRQADFTLPPGTTLRAAVASKVKPWLNRQQIPVFAQTLSVEQIAELLPDSSPEAMNAIQLLLKSQSSDSDLMEVLLTELPRCLGAPEQHAAWDQTTVEGLLSSWMTVCELLAHLPVVLKERTIRRAAALFDAEQYAPEDHWGAVIRWRLNRGSIPSGRLQGLAQDLFRLTNMVGGSIEQTLLDDFARRVIGVGVEYQRWQDLEKIEKVFNELTKARDEIDRAWAEVAQGDEIWREGLVRTVSGRAVSGVSADQAATELAAWNSELSWPACAQSLSPRQIREIYTEITPEAAHDLVVMLKRIDYDASRWRRDLIEGLPKELGVQGYTRSEVMAALRRLETVLPLAASLETRLQRHVQQQIVALFGATVGVAADATANEVLAQWRDRYSIPEPNDLSADAKSMLFHINNWAGEAEPLVLTTLPRALSAVGRPVRQWEQFDLLKSYVEALRSLLGEIASYEPLSAPAYRWLSGVLRATEREQATLPRERRKLTELVATELSVWLRERRLPPFVADLDLEQLRSIFPDADAPTLNALHWLLHREAVTAAQRLVSQALPVALGLPLEQTQWDEPGVKLAVERFVGVCHRVGTLPDTLRRGLYIEISQIFHAITPVTSSAELLAQMRAWRSSYVILPKDAVSDNARLVYESLAGREDDPDTLLLERLPAKMGEVREMYGRWRSWSLRDRYLHALKLSAEEIEQYAVHRTNDQGEALWHDFRRRLAELGADEQRWVVKAFRDEFQQ
ncbi:hypothetical protein [Candidatus Chloroploca sp. Khr17]|uniref:hypothetical protein n=1 Tax=Candidatus Chloroploca sp. Khr17 TaxID=2496869 RepID=UPI00101BC3CC|nr:hypothetical protein [Candidatus Chloroploca sp. Khr17]